MSQTAETVWAYLARGQQLWLRAAREIGISPDALLPTGYLTWLKALLPKLLPASRRQYIASTRELFSAMQAAGLANSGIAGDLPSAIHQARRMCSADYSPLKSVVPWRGRTSRQKAKRCGIEMLVELSRTAAKMRGKWVKPALLWMSANLMVGLRPSEWRHARIVSSADGMALEIRNGKATNGRAHGEFRHLLLTGLTSTERKWVQMQLAEAGKHTSSDENWKTYYDGVRKTLHRIARSALSSQRKYPTLYSTRHQFAADAKSAGLPLEEIAALMGHATDDTATVHYGKRAHGKGRCPIRPNTDEVANVRKVASNRIHSESKKVT